MNSIVRLSVLFAAAFCMLHTSARAQLSTPNLTNPANGATNVATSSVTFQWNAVSGANVYRFRLGADSLIANPLIWDTSCVEASRSVQNLQPGTKYYWRVRAKNTNTQVVSGWSVTRWFITAGSGGGSGSGGSGGGTSTGATLKLLTPTSGKLLTTNSADLSWTGVTGASAYHFQVGLSPAFPSGALFLQDSTMTSTTRTVQGLTSGRMYYWRARVKVASGWGGWSPTWSFFVVRTGAVVVQNPIVYATQIPATGFTAVGEPFANHKSDPFYAPRGGDLWIRYPDGSEKNLTRTAGYGETNTDQNTSRAIAVRDPAPSWDGMKVVFSMVVGEQQSFSDNGKYVWQLYEATNLGQNQTPVITKVANQPLTFNNISPIYGTDGRIIFTSDRPRSGQQHHYPQLDEYELTAVNSGLWSLDAATGDLRLLDHAPSGDYTPSLDSYGRVIFTRWDHLQRDQEADIDNTNGPGTAGIYGTFNYADESATAQKTFANRTEFFPEPRIPVSGSNVNAHFFNFFFPWQINEDGMEAETMNHVGRHDLLGAYLSTSFTNDGNLKSFVNSYDANVGTMREMMLQIREDQVNPGVYFFAESDENGQNSAGQIMCITGDPALDPQDMTISYITDIATRHSLGEGAQPTLQHSGHYRNPLPLVSGDILVAHSTNNYLDRNIGTQLNPVYRDNFRIKPLQFNGTRWVAGNPITTGSQRTVRNWNGGQWVTWQGTLWEWQPVELRARTIPSRLGVKVLSPEAQIMQEESVDSTALRNYLTRKNAALMVARDVTNRNADDTHQPYFLRIEGTTKQSTGATGKIYDVAHLQILQADQIRGKGLMSPGGTPLAGRRVLAQPAHDPVFALNSQQQGTPTGGVNLASDGSMAAIVPAQRAMTWQLTSTAAVPVVRERIWVTFQPGEIRVCASCHGSNPAALTSHQAAPQNKPEALRGVLQALKAHSVSSVAPSLQSPANNATMVSMPTAFSWSDVGNASSFNLQVSTNSTFTSIVADVKNILQPTANIQLQPTTTYYWRVRSADLTGYGTWSSVWSFQTMPAGSPASAENDVVAASEPFLLATPNPANDQVDISFTLPTHSAYTIELTDYVGRVVLQTPWQTSSETGRKTLPLDITMLPSGVFTLILRTQDRLYSSLIFVRH